jgi:formyltetrahydrofolate deformylase
MKVLVCIWLFAAAALSIEAFSLSPTKIRVTSGPGSSSFRLLDALQENQEGTPRRGILRVFGPDRNGIVAAFSQLLNGHGCGIFSSEQSTDTATNMFFQRISFDYSSMHTDEITLESGIREVCARMNMNTDLDWNKNRKRVAIMVSKYDHCLWELLLRHKAGELDCDISVIISNHPDLKPIADNFGIPFEVFKITKDTKKEQEARELELLNNLDIDLVILARYMQIISDDFCRAFPHRVINIHHSFLPAFIGARPYHRAHERGVKLIGATAHYATAELDEGPIIEQDIARISHRDAVNDLIRKGRILEKNTLVGAVKAHLEDRIIVYNNKCVVFGD